eukprot:6253145-Prorocentrum_lima.AAC.1
MDPGSSTMPSLPHMNTPPRISNTRRKFSCDRSIGILTSCNNSTKVFRRNQWMGSRTKTTIFGSRFA